MNTMDESRKRAENEKLTMVENLSNLRGHKKALEDQLASHKVKIHHIFLSNALRTAVTWVFPVLLIDFSGFLLVGFT